MSRLRVEGISVSFAGTPPARALREVDLDAPDGTLTAVLGPSGCGKTTLLRVIAGLQRPGSGIVEIDGTVVDGAGIHVPPERRSVGLVPQDGALFPHLDVARNIAFGLRRRPVAERQERVEELLALVGLEGYGPRRPSDLSGGQQQRVALARALAPSPSLVLLDEPFSALDSGLRAEVRTEVAGLLRQAATTALLVTHDETEALEIADMVAVLREGRVVQVDRPQDLYRRPVDAWVGSFIGPAVVLPGVARDGVAETVLGRTPTAPGQVGGDVDVFLRPEQLHPAAAIDGIAVTEVTVVEVRFRGAVTAVVVDANGTKVPMTWSGSAPPTVGDVIGIRVEGRALTYPRSDDRRREERGPRPSVRPDR